MKKTWKRLGGVLLTLLVMYFLFWPVEIDPEVWNPEDIPELTGVYDVNHKLDEVDHVGSGMGVGPEDVVVDANGNIYGGLLDGRIVRLQPDGSLPETFADTGGRPLGMDFDAEGNLIVADAYMGVLSISPDGQITPLTTEYNGVPFKYLNDVDVAEDGTVYFTQTSAKFPFDKYTEDLMEHRPNGSLYAYHPESGETELLVDGIYYANGVGMGPDGDSVFYSEMGLYQIHRLWLAGPKAGQDEVFADNLPGFPDSLSPVENGILWVPFVSPRKPEIELIMPFPFLRKMVMRLPAALLPAAENYGFVIGLDMDGNVVYNLQDPEAGYTQISSVRAVGEWLYLGSIEEDAIGRIRVP